MILSNEGHPKSLGQWQRRGCRGWPYLHWDEDFYNDLDLFEDAVDEKISIRMQSLPSQRKHLDQLQRGIGRQCITTVIGNNVVCIGEGDMVELGKGNPQGKRLTPFSGKARIA